MGLFNRKKKEEPKAQANTNESEFDRDVRALLARDDIQCREDVCEAEYTKAKGLLDNPTQETVRRAYDIMGHLAAQFGYAPAMTWMGDFAENVKKDLSEAVNWYKKAADLGDGNGARCYADMLMAGVGVARDPREAMKYYTVAANAGVPEAAFVLGEFFRTHGDRENALKAYRQALAGGYAPAQTRINQMNG